MSKPTAHLSNSGKQKKERGGGRGEEKKKNRGRRSRWPFWLLDLFPRGAQRKGRREGGGKREFSLSFSFSPVDLLDAQRGGGGREREREKDGRQRRMNGQIVERCR